MHHLRARIAWLSRHVNASLPPGQAPVESVKTGLDLELSTAMAARSQHSSPSSTMAVDALRDMRRDVMPDVHPQSVSPSSITGATMTCASDVSSTTLPQDALARRLVDAYFRNVNRAYPFVDREKVLRDLEMAADDGDAASGSGSGATLLYLIMAIGCTTLQRAGQISSDVAAKFHVNYTVILQECFGREEDVESVQILVLLALYSFFDPNGASAWSIVGMVSSQAILLGLSRRVRPEEAASGSMTVVAAELRHRLFWSIYILDRMIAASRGLPVALVDENIDVPLPSLTIDEFASPARATAASILQTSRHVIQLRQLEDRILRDVYARKQAEVSALAPAERRALLQNIRAEIENWYSSGCLLSPLELEPDNVPIHNSITWLSARYYNILLLLYYPSRFNGFSPTVSRAELLRFAQKYLQATAALHQQRQLPLNRVTLCRLLPVSLVLMHTFMAYAAEGAAFPAADDVPVLVHIAESFAEGWTQAIQAAHILRRFLAVISGFSGMSGPSPSPVYPPNYYPQTARGSTKVMMQPLIAAMLALMQDTLGRTSFFLFQELYDERETRQPQEPTPHQPSQHGPPQTIGSVSDAGSIVSATPVQSGPMMNYGWGPLGLDFL